MPEAHEQKIEISKKQRVMLSRALSKLGLCSRQEAVRAIRAGRVSVNGKVARDTLYWITLGEDRIQLDGNAVTNTQSLRYFMLHKPPGYVTTRRDEFKRPTVFDLMPMAQAALGKSSSRRDWLFPVGRLDCDSEGLLLFTNDGPLSDALAHPKSHVEKVYRVLLDRMPPEAGLRRLAQGLMLDDQLTLPAKVAHDPQAGNDNWLYITIHEGRNRQVRRKYESEGRSVMSLIRTRIGQLALGDLLAGQWRELTQPEVQALKRATGQRNNLTEHKRPQQ